MNFLNWALLGGVGAVAAPIIIHLLNRSRFQTVQWGAMHLLDHCLKVNSRRPTWEEWLLLALRCLIPVLFALCLARPVLNAWQATASLSRSLVILIDNSQSMAAAYSETESCLDAARRLAIEIMERQPHNCQIGVWTIGGYPIDLLGGTTTDQVRAQARLRTMKAGAGPVDLQAALTTALRQLQTMTAQQKEVIVISDFQPAEWQRLSQSARQALRDQSNTLDPSAGITLLPVKASERQLSNLSIHMEPIESTWLLVARPVRVLVTIRNHGQQEVADVVVALDVAGKELAQQAVSVAAAGSVQVAFECQVETAGDHLLTVSVTDRAGRPGDDQCYRLLKIREPLKALLIDEQADESELKRPSGYIELALTPYPSASRQNLATCKRMKPNELRPDEFKAHDIVVMTNVTRLSQENAKALRDYVYQGGGLFIAGGNKLDARWYEETWGLLADHPLLPMRYQARPWSDSEQPQMALEPLPHPALAGLPKLALAELTSWEVRRWNMLVPLHKPAGRTNEDSSGDASQATEVLLKLADDTPLVVAKRMGRGRVLQMACAASTDGSNLPLRTTFVPLVLSFTHWLAVGESDDRNFEAGQLLPLADIFGRTSKELESADLKLTVQATDQDTVTLTWPGSGTAPLYTAAFPGVYRLQLSEAPADSQVADSQVADSQVADSQVADSQVADSQVADSQVLAVNLPDSESDNERLTDPLLQAGAEALGGKVAETVEAVGRIVQRQDTGRELWRWLLLGLLIVIASELWLQQRISRGVT